MPRLKVKDMPRKQQMAVKATMADGGKGHPKNKKKSPKKFLITRGKGGFKATGGNLVPELRVLGSASMPFKMKSPMKKKGKKDACYHKVKRSAKVWPSAYASGRLVRCRKVGASNYGKKK